MAKTPAWQRKEGKNPEGGLNAKGRASYNAANPGKPGLKRPQPEGGPRRDSFCARMKGMKKKLTSAKTANDPNSRINKSLRAWNCKEGGSVRGGGCEEPAFRFELALASIMLPASLWVGRDWVEVSLLAGTVLLVMLVELLNTAIEAAVDLNTEEWNALAKRAKDTGSAAVFLSMLWCGGTWLGAMAHKWSWW